MNLLSAFVPHRSLRQDGSETEWSSTRVISLRVLSLLRVPEVSDDESRRESVFLASGAQWGIPAWRRLVSVLENRTI